MKIVQSIASRIPNRWFNMLFGPLALLVMLLPGLAHGQTFPPLTGRVVDAAHVLNPQQIAQLEQISADAEKASTRQLVVATIPDLQGYAIEDYGYKLGRAWGIGQKGANNGVILIIAPKDREVRIEAGYGLEPIMTDAMSNSIISEAVIPKFKAGDMPGGIIAGTQAIAEQLKLPLEAAEQRAAQAAAKAKPKHGSSGDAPLVIAFVVMFGLFFVVPMLFRRAGGQRYAAGAGGSGRGWNDVWLWGPVILDELSRGGRGSSWGGGSGGSDWGGGDSGGGGFSGGGGSFGGGGASGSW